MGLRETSNLLLDFCSDMFSPIVFSSYGISVTLVKGFSTCVLSYPPTYILFSPLCEPYEIL